MKDKSKMIKKELEERQIVLCTVTKIAGTIVFVNIEDYDLEGTITFSEISPGRIRNIRDYVIPGKKIICKVLRVDKRGVHLSLRRVKQKERNEFNEMHKKEKSFKALLKTILKDKTKSKKIIEEIKEKEESISDFLGSLREDPKLLEKYIQKKEAEQIIQILESKKEKEIVLSREFSLKSKDPKGISIIKNIIKEATKECDDCNVSYVAAGKYRIKVKTKDPKKTDSQLDSIMKNLEDLAKQKDSKFSE